MKPASSLYVHLPFCRTRCGYCDFVTSAATEIPFNNYASKIKREFSAKQEITAPLKSVYIGGGTPSLWPDFILADILKTLFQLKNRKIEVTIEVNPKDADEKWFKNLVNAGVSRFSIGVQSLNNNRLKWLGRRHNAKDAEDAVKMALNSGAESVSSDLIYGTPGMTPDELTVELEMTADLGLHHISAYELTLAPHTPLGKKGVVLPDSDKMADMWWHIREKLKSYGFEQYEVSNYAVKGHKSLHNIHYWKGGYYTGLGAGAHGFVEFKNKSIRYFNSPFIDDYLNAPLSEKTVAVGEQGFFENITPLQKQQELIMLGLRTSCGFDFEQIKKAVPPKTAVKWQQHMDKIKKDGYITSNSGRINPTPAGMLMADSLALLFF
jgi:oxygen-independent coproporphyrinogen-3 oxidase